MRDLFCRIDPETDEPHWGDGDPVVFRHPRLQWVVAMLAVELEEERAALDEGSEFANARTIAENEEAISRLTHGKPVTMSDVECLRGTWCRRCCADDVIQCGCSDEVLRDYFGMNP